MRHRKAGRKLGRNSTSRKAMFRNMVTSLLEHEQIRTTEAKAKELRGYAERVITLGRRAPSEADIDALSGDARQKAQAQRVHAIRRAALWVHDQDVLRRLFSEYAERYKDRPGGYTRVIKAGVRPGDNAPMAIIELVREPLAQGGEDDTSHVAEDAAATSEEAAAPAEDDVAPSAEGADDADAEQATDGGDEAGAEGTDEDDRG
jgi:large subunit ribosomal protein L17